MPNPAKYKNTDKDYKRYMKDCMHQTTHMERKKKEHGIAQCLNMWRKVHGPKKPGKAQRKKMAMNVMMRFITSSIHGIEEGIIKGGFVGPDKPGAPEKLISKEEVISALKKHSGVKDVKVTKDIPGVQVRLTAELKSGHFLSINIEQESTDRNILDIGLLDKEKHLIELSKSIKFRDGTQKIEFRELNTLLDWIRNDLPKELAKNQK